MNPNMVKAEKFGHLHSVYHFIVPLTQFKPKIRIPNLQKSDKISDHYMTQFFKELVLLINT